MAISLNTNLTAISTQRSLSTSQSALAISLNRLSSGLRINRAQDDAAGLGISSRMTAQIKGTTQAVRNANDGISMVQTAEGAMGSISDNLQRMRELAVQAANAPVSNSDRKLIDAEVQMLSLEIQRIASSTQFNGIRLLDGSFNSHSFFVGAHSGDAISISHISNMQTTHLGLMRVQPHQGLAPRPAQKSSARPPAHSPPLQHLTLMAWILARSRQAQMQIAKALIWPMPLQALPLKRASRRRPALAK